MLGPESRRKGMGAGGGGGGGGCIIVPLQFAFNKCGIEMEDSFLCHTSLYTVIHF